jgi:DUF1680 family protein
MEPAWQPVARKNVTLTGGFWQRWTNLVGNTTLQHELDQLRHQGQLDALLLNQRLHRGLKIDKADSDWYWGGSIFWDSDTAKWLEAASARLEKTPDAELTEAVESVIGRLQKAQQPDGYLNTHILTWRPRHRFKNLRDLHELYCAGHLFEAAAVHFEATGQRSLLDIATHYADYLTKVFGPKEGQLPGYCGHPEIELALLRLYRVTQKPAYLELCRFFINERGRFPNYFEQEAVQRLDTRPFRPGHPGSPFAYMQADRPIREQSRVVGHAVRAMYLFAAVAELASIDHDEELLAACHRVWDDLNQTKLYITGGIGSAAENEGFTSDYDLPNETAYAETCASIGLFLFAHRLLLVDLDSRYSDLMELALHNNILSGLSLDGKRFFYDNPLASRGQHHRVEWPWWCPCCPPNLARLILSLPGYVASVRDTILAVHLFVDCDLNTSIQGAPVTLRTRTQLPFEGQTVLTVDSDRATRFTLAVRIPAWATNHKYQLRGGAIAPTGQKGYAYFEREWQSGDELTVQFDLPVRAIHARYEVESDRGRVALSRGPLVYCIESRDNGPKLDRYLVDAAGEYEVSFEPDVLGGVNVIRATASREELVTEGLYSTEAPQRKPGQVTAIPYYAWDNRDPGEMLVWVRAAGG